MINQDSEESCPWIPQWLSTKDLKGFTNLFTYYNALVENSEGSKGPFLKRLSSILLFLSSAVSANEFTCLDAWSISIRTKDLSMDIKLADIETLHDLINDKLFHEVRCLFLLNQSDEISALLPENHNDIYLFLRCCIRILPLLEFDCSLSQFAATKLAALFRNLCSKLVFETILDCKQRLQIEGQGCGDAMIDCSQKGKFAKEQGSGSIMCQLIYFYAGLLEVFVDELVMHPDLVKSFTVVDNDSFEFLESRTPLKLGECTEIVLEGLFVHFLLSCEGKISNFFFPKIEKNGVVANTNLSLPTSVLLVDVITSVKCPKIFKAHVLNLVSETLFSHSLPIDGGLPLDLELGLLVSLLESSANLYAVHSSLGNDLKGKCMNFDSTESSALESCLIKYKSLQTRHSLESKLLISMMWNEDCWLCKSDLCNEPCKRKHDSYTENPFNALKESLSVYIQTDSFYLDDFIGDEVKEILLQLIMNAHVEALKADIPFNQQRGSEPAILLVAAILQLLASSLQRLVPLLRDYHIQSDYHHHTINKLVACIQLGSPLTPYVNAINNAMTDMFGKRPEGLRHVLNYFMSDLMLRFSLGSHTLCKGLIDVIKSLISLFLLEKGARRVLKELVNRDELRNNILHEHLVPKDSIPVPYAAVKCLISTDLAPDKMEPQLKSLILSYLKKRDSQRFQRIRKKRHRKFNMFYEDEDESEPDIVVSPEKSIQKNPFVFALLKTQSVTENDFSGLEDFIVCKQDKDYLAYLEKRRRFREKKYEREFWKRQERRRKLLASLSNKGGRGT